MDREVSNRADPAGRSADGHTVEHDRLSKWLLFSFVVHCVLIAVMFIVPSLPVQTASQFPVYSVDLVGGEKIGGMKFGTELAPRPVKQVAKKSEPEPPRPVAKAQPEVKKENAEKAKVVEKAPPPAETVAAAEKPRSEIAKPEPVKEKKTVQTAPPPAETVAAVEKPRSEIAKPKPAVETKAEPTEQAEAKAEPADPALDRVREKLIQSAVERVKSRAESAQKAATPANNKGEVLSSGPGEGEGAAALGPGGRGGGIIKGIEFVAYQAKLFEIIRANWAWIGQRTDLRVVVRFGIRENGEIVGLRVVQPSGDPSYDDSVLRALTKSSPFPSPPEAYRRDFASVELAFRPKDLGA